MSSLGYPGAIAGGFSGEKPTEAPLLPLQIQLEETQKLSETTIIFTIAITNIGQKAVPIPKSVDQVRTHSHATSRIIGDFRLTNIFENAQRKDGTAETLYVQTFGSKTQADSLAMLLPGDTVCMRLKSFAETSIAQWGTLDLRLSYQQITLKDDAFQIDTLFSPILSDNTVTLEHK